jgi:hypothetical protein
MNLFEGKYDQLTGLIVDAIWFIVKQSKKLYDRTGEELYATKPLNIKDLVDFKYQVIIQREEGLESYAMNASTYNNKIVFSISIDPEIEPEIYSEMNDDLQGTVRHEIEHILQEKAVPGTVPFPSRYRLNKINKDPLEYFMSDFEMEAMVMGFYRMAKTQKEKLDVVIQHYLNYFIEDGSITRKQAKVIKDKWLDYAKKHLPKAQYKGKKMKLVKESLNEENINPYDKLGMAMAKKMGVKPPFKKKKTKGNQNAITQTVK